MQNLGKILLLLPLLSLLIIPVYGETESKDCIFTAYIADSWSYVPFGDHVRVSGQVINCDDNIQYFEKNRIDIRILDVNGNVLEDNWQPAKITSNSQQAAKYEFTDDVYREKGFRGNFDNSQGDKIHIKPNQYSFYIPQINSLDFKHGGIYQVELTYGEHVRFVNFRTLDLEYIQSYLDKKIESDKNIKNNIGTVPTDIPIKKKVKEETKIDPLAEFEKYKTGTASISGDISKYDIPTEGRNSDKETFLMIFKTNNVIDSIKLGEKFQINGYVYNVRNQDRIENATVNVEISRDGFVQHTSKYTSGTGGVVNIDIRNTDYPLFYPEWCYDVTITTTYGDYTDIFKDDFLVEYKTQIWNPNMSWVNFERWSYLPSDYKVEPRQMLYSDETCN